MTSNSCIIPFPRHRSRRATRSSAATLSTPLATPGPCHAHNQFPKPTAPRTANSRPSLFNHPSCLYIDIPEVASPFNSLVTRFVSLINALRDVPTHFIILYPSPLYTTKAYSLSLFLWVFRLDSGLIGFYQVYLTKASLIH